MLKHFKNGLLHGFGILLIVGLGGLAYGAWTTISTETDGQPLSAAKWNILVNRLNSIDEKSLPTAWVNFNGTSCTGGVGGNECVIKDSYNINKVTRITTGKYNIYFQNIMDNTNYSISSSNIGSTVAYYATFISSNGVINNTNYFSVEARNVTTSIYDQDNISIQVYGGKTY
ncbi:MAG: hypothetical protein PHS49_04670 [Candidatus Gracilibacteria bacterium]|nr:hypothetical protein [Candidatus Gracilibacteria bacterium]